MVEQQAISGAVNTRNNHNLIAGFVSFMFSISYLGVTLRYMYMSYCLSSFYH